MSELSDDDKRYYNEEYYRSRQYQAWSSYVPDALAAGGEDFECACAAHPGQRIRIKVPFPKFRVVTYEGGRAVINAEQAELNQDWLEEHLSAQAVANGGNRDIPTEGIEYAQQCTDFGHAQRTQHFNKVKELTGTGAFPILMPPYPEVGRGLMSGPA